MNNLRTDEINKDDGMAHKVAGFGRDTAVTARGMVKKAETAINDIVDSDTVKAVVHAVEGGISDVGTWMSGAQKNATATVRKYPVQSVLLGFGLGALLATLVRNPRRE